VKAGLKIAITCLKKDGLNSNEKLFLPKILNYCNSTSLIYVEEKNC